MVIIETGHIRLVDFENDRKIEETIFKILDSLEIRNGASHTEFEIIANNEIDYVKLVIDIALGI